jgi:hypothetical protein
VKVSPLSSTLHNIRFHIAVTVKEAFSFTTALIGCFLASFTTGYLSVL